MLLRGFSNNAIKIEAIIYYELSRSLSNHQMSCLVFFLLFSSHTPFLPHLHFLQTPQKLSQYLYLCLLYNVTLLCNTQLQKIFFFDVVPFHLLWTSASREQRKILPRLKMAKKRARKPLRRSIKVFSEATFQISTFSMQCWFLPFVVINFFYSP